MTKPKLLITRELGPAVIARAQRDYDASLNESGRIMSPEELLDRCAGKEALLVTVSEKFPSDIIAKLPASVRIIAT